MPVEEYTLKHDMVCEQYGKAFLLRRGSKCHYFEHNDCYLFDAQNNYVPYFERATVESFPQFFRPVGGLAQRAADLRSAHRVPCTCGFDDGLHEWDCAISRANR